MSEINIHQEVKRLEEKGEHLAIKRILKADSFDIVLIAYDSQADVDLHECGKDEFFYVLKGEVEIQVENKSTLLKEGVGLLVKAGEKHKHRPIDRAWIMTITKHPHKHKSYKEIRPTTPE